MPALKLTAAAVGFGKGLGWTDANGWRNEWLATRDRLQLIRNLSLSVCFWLTNQSPDFVTVCD